jgi:hypothetical protein
VYWIKEAQYGTSCGGEGGEIGKCLGQVIVAVSLSVHFVTYDRCLFNDAVNISAPNDRTTVNYELKQK